ncbi:SUPT6H (predicted) [Pycnogonum litorale]
MAAFARDVITYKYFRDGNGGKREVMEQLILEDKQKQPSKIHYLVSASKEFPGKFMISYIPRNKVRHEYLTVTPEGFRFRQQIFPSLSSLLRWFKEHFRDPIPGTAPQSVIGARTPMGQSSYIGAGATPSINLANVNVETIQRAAANLPSHVFNTLSQVAGQTPVHFGYQPYTPSQPVATPIMTPSYPITTPRYQPVPSWATPGHLVQTPSHHTPHHNQPVIPLHIQQIPARTRTMAQSVTPIMTPLIR